MRPPPPTTRPTTRPVDTPPGPLRRGRRSSQQHSARVYRLAYRLTGNPHDAEDLTHDVFIRVFRSLHSYQPGTFEGWLHRITTNVFLDKMRRKQRIRFDALPEDAASRLPSREPGPEQTFDDTHFDDDVQQRARRPAAGLPRGRRPLRHRGALLRGDRRDARRQARHRPLAHPPRPRPAARGPRAPRSAACARTTTASRPVRRRFASGGLSRGPVTVAAVPLTRHLGRRSARTSTVGSTRGSPARRRPAPGGVPRCRPPPRRSGGC